MLLKGWANRPEMASVRVARLDPETIVVLLEVAVVLAQLDNSGLAADAAVAILVVVSFASRFSALLSFLCK